MNAYAGPDVSWLALAPLLATSVAAILVVTLEALRHRLPWSESLSFPISVAGVAVAGAFLFPVWRRVVDEGPYTTLGGAVAVDGLATFLQAVVLIAAGGALLVAFGYLRRDGLDERGEHHALILLSATGMMAIAAAADLVVVFVALEVLSIPLYVLAGFRRDRATSQEASLKYLILGSLSSAVFLYGVALVYGATGTTALRGIREYTASEEINEEILLVGIVLLIVGLGFKVSAVPFHLWTPDVYQGAPTPITGFMAAGAKAAGFAALFRVLIVGMFGQSDDWRPLVWVLAVLTLLVASTTAILQRDVKRMLAYSSISHAGFILIGLYAFSPDGVSAALVYLATYAVMIIGTFAVVTVLGRRGDTAHDLDDYRGMARREPFLAGVLTLFLFAQAGIPLTSGFVAKLGVFNAAVGRDSGAVPGVADDEAAMALAIIGVFAAVVAAFIYLRVVIVMYAGSDDHAVEGSAEDGGDDAPDGRDRLHVDLATGLVIVAAAAITLYLGVLPKEIVDLADEATAALIG